jgi:hypothetical protein
MGKRGCGRQVAKLANRAVGDDGSVREPCSYCGVELRLRTYVVCAECAMPTVVLCLDCFAAGAAWFPHHAAHDYRVIAEMHKPVFEAGWAAAEESRLLDAISVHGPFSWAAVAEVMDTKSASECKVHYSRVYLESPTAPLPDYDVMVPSDNVQQGAQAKSAPLQMPHAVNSSSAPMRVEKQRRRIQPIRVSSSSDSSASERSVGDGRGQNTPLSRQGQFGSAPGALNATTAPNVVVLDAARRQASSTPRLHRRLEARRVTDDSSELEDEDDSDSVASSDRQDGDEDESGASDDGHLPGFYSKRGDFDAEWDDLAEESIANLSITDADTPEEVELKLRLLELYNIRLDERETVKRFAFADSLVDISRLSREDESVKVDELEARRWLKRFRRVLTPEQQLVLESAVLAEDYLRRELALLASYRSLGIRNFTQLRRYNSDASDRMRELGYYYKSGFWKSASDQNINIPANSVPLLKVADDLQLDSHSDVAGNETDISQDGTLYSVIRTRNTVSSDHQLSIIDREICCILRLSPDDFFGLKSALVRQVDAVGYDLCGMDEKKVTVIDLCIPSSNHPACCSLNCEGAACAAHEAASINLPSLQMPYVTRARLLSRLEATREGLSFSSPNFHPALVRSHYDARNRFGQPPPSADAKNSEKRLASESSSGKPSGQVSIERGQKLLSAEEKRGELPHTANSKLTPVERGRLGEIGWDGKPSVMSIEASRTERLNLKLRLYDDGTAAPETAGVQSIAATLRGPVGCYAEVIEDEMASRMKAMEERAFRSAYCKNLRDDQDLKELTTGAALHARILDGTAVELLPSSNKADEGVQDEARSDVHEMRDGLSGKPFIVKGAEERAAVLNADYPAAYPHIAAAHSSAIGKRRQEGSVESSGGWRKAEETASSAPSFSAKKEVACIPDSIFTSATPIDSRLAPVDLKETNDELPSYLPGAMKDADMTENRDSNRDYPSSRSNEETAAGGHRTVGDEKATCASEGSESGARASKECSSLRDQRASGRVQRSGWDGSRYTGSTPGSEAVDHSQTLGERRDVDTLALCVAPGLGNYCPDNLDPDCLPQREGSVPREGGAPRTSKRLEFRMAHSCCPSVDALFEVGL